MTSKSYYANFLKSKSLPLKPATARTRSTLPPTRELSDLQRAAYNWLVDNGVLTLIDNIDQDSLVEIVSAHDYAVFHKIGRLFALKFARGRSLKETLRGMVQSFHEKGILPTSIVVDRLVHNDPNEVLSVLVYCHQFARRDRFSEDAAAADLSDWLTKLGIQPPVESPPSLLHDRVRNGDLLRDLCVVLRPELFQGVMPPARSPQEMVTRIRQSLAILAEEKAVENPTILSPEDIVRGNMGINQVIAGVKKLWESRSMAMMERVTPILRGPVC
jgi:hypothetical protein